MKIISILSGGAYRQRTNTKQPSSFYLDCGLLTNNPLPGSTPGRSNSRFQDRQRLKLSLGGEAPSSNPHLPLLFLSTLDVGRLKQRRSILIPQQPRRLF